MGTPIEIDRLFSTAFNNSEKDIASAGTDVTYEFSSSGSDTDSTIYMGMGRHAYSVDIRPSALVKIVSINGVELKDPITVQTTGFSSNKIRIRQMVVRTQSASTNIKLFAC